MKQIKTPTDTLPTVGNASSVPSNAGVSAGYLYVPRPPEPQYTRLILAFHDFGLGERLPDEWRPEAPGTAQDAERLKKAATWARRWGIRVEVRP